MSAYVIDSTLFRDQFSTAQTRDIFSDEQTVQRWLDVEAALAKVQARMGIIPQSAADSIAAVANAGTFDTAALAQATLRAGTPGIPLVKALTEQVRDADPAAAGGASHIFENQQTEFHSRSRCVLPFWLPVSGIRQIL